jgi:hypothetical protein
MKHKCRVVYEMVLHCTRKEIFGLWRRSSLIAQQETAEHFGPSINESDNKHTGLLPGPVDSTTNQRRRETSAKFRIQVELRKTLRKRLAFSLLNRPPLAEMIACPSTQVFVLKNLPQKCLYREAAVPTSKHSRSQRQPRLYPCSLEAVGTVYI